ncbi:alcohol dehydrogenase [Aspergillus karnatakaensis]|uniref:zinc-dependent alcohol dehydrogenase family protein n=1 Tax=Aspergillus karnatakaensis TaxID=1810916 RepID=UPI003CCDD9A4
MITPTSTPTWLLTTQNGPSSLQFLPNHPLPPLGPTDILVQIHAASLNYREIAIAKGKFNLPLPNPITPSSDGAGVILATGSAIDPSIFKQGDKVVTHLTVNQPFDSPATFSDIGTGLGQIAHGTLRKYGVFHESSLVKMPGNLSFREAATLTCSGLTAWNALNGIRGREVKKGDYVLVQGSGGVSVAALQFAVASGATVIATTSSPAKASRLRSLGAKEVINYRETENWGEAAREFTPDSRGFDIVVDVGGPSTVAQSLRAIRPDGIIALAGLLGAGEDVKNIPSIMDGLSYLCTTRGFLLGSRKQFGDMVRFIEEHKVKPVVDERVFGFGEVKEAYEFLEAQRHFSKVVIDVE